MTSTRELDLPAVSSTTPHSWVPYAAVAAGAALLIKAVAIVGSEDQVSSGAMVGLYLGGLLVGLVAAVGAGLRARRGRRTLVGVGLAFLLVAYTMVLSDGVGELFAITSDAPWVADEGPVGLLGLVLLVCGARARQSH